MGKKFEFCGCTFLPHGTFSDFGLGNADLKKLGAHLHFTDNDAFKAEGGYTYDAFYEAAGGYDSCASDVFVNLTNGLLYTPTKYQLQIFFEDEDDADSFDKEKECRKEELNTFGELQTALERVVELARLRHYYSARANEAKDWLAEVMEEYNELLRVQKTI